MSDQERIGKIKIIRNYARQFFVGGFKGDKDYIIGENESKSNRKTSKTGLRNRKKKIKNYLGNTMTFKEDKNKVSLSTDSRTIKSNPFYDIYKAKSFSEYDIVLRFLIMDSIAELEKQHKDGVSLDEIIDDLTNNKEYFADIQTEEAHIDELVELGLITKTVVEKGKKTRNKYSVTRHSKELIDELNALKYAITFFSEADPLGVIGYYTTEMLESYPDLFRFKQKYIFRAIDSEILYKLICAINNKNPIKISVTREEKNKLISDERNVFPYKVYVSSQSGRQHLFYWECESKKPSFVRIDQIEAVKRLPKTEDVSFDTIYDKIKENYWGVSSQYSEKTEHIEFVVDIKENEQHIYNKLMNEKRNGTVEQVENSTTLWRFSADVYDTREMIVWIRTFIGRIISISCDNEDVYNRLIEDFNNLCTAYKINGGDNNAV